MDETEKVSSGDLMVLENVLPDHFSDEDFMELKSNKIHPGVFKQFYPSLGLLLKIRRGARHICQTCKRNMAEGRDQHEDTPELLWKLWNMFVWPWSFEREKWTPELLFFVSDELKEMGSFLSGKLLAALGQHVLLPTTLERGIIFDQKYIDMVTKYHDGLERHGSTDKDAVNRQLKSEKSLHIAELAELPRDLCPSCMCRQHIYCGDCFGVPMGNAEPFLPADKISLPFKVVLLLDWHETLHKCTGIHAAVLCKEGTVSVQKWPRSGRPDDLDSYHDVDACGWAEVARSFNYDHDIVLFPCENSMDIQDLNWCNSCDDVADEMVEQFESMSLSTIDRGHSSDNTSKNSAFSRLILIESTWGGAKTIVSSLQHVRSVLGLPALRCASLPETIHGLYWKLQRVGSSAVSTIEALSHAASACGCSAGEAETLLTLFYLQRYRVMKKVEKGQGKVPKAVDVRGPWRKFCES